MNETTGNKFLRKIRTDPAVPVGILGALGVIGYSFQKYQTAKKTMSLSNFLMQLRVTAQATVVGCIALGVGYKAISEYLGGKKESEPVD